MSATATNGHGSPGRAAPAPRRRRGRDRGGRRRARLGARRRQGPRGEPIPPADLDERDPDYIRESLPRLWLLCSLYFRGEVRGLGNVPEEGGVLLVGNHSGGNLTPDTTVFTLAFSTYFGVERAFHQLAHNLVLSFPGLSYLRKYGTVAASPRTRARRWRRARRCSSTRAATTRSTGRAGSATGSTSAAARASSGSRSTRTCRSCPSSPSAGRRPRCSSRAASRWRRCSGSTGCSGLKVLPISLALPWGPQRRRHARPHPAAGQDHGRGAAADPPARGVRPEPDVDEVYDHVVRLMQDTLDALAAERRLPVLG